MMIQDCFPSQQEAHLQNKLQKYKLLRAIQNASKSSASSECRTARLFGKAPVLSQMVRSAPARSSSLTPSANWQRVLWKSGVRPLLSRH